MTNQLTLDHKPDCEAYCRGELSCDCGALQSKESSSSPPASELLVELDREGE